ncbi:hypothetical protein HY441_01840 [Candidatus Microgenomates bacterium]|nr:hypothetical protein [Candidatus Microgenomates bacterium]
MRFVVDSKIFKRFDNPRIAVTVAKGADNTVEVSEIHSMTKDVIDQIRQNYKSETLSQQPKIAAWREAHRQFGSKAKDYPSSVEALYKRVLRGDDIKPINPLVDIYNYISLKYMLTAGGEDLDKMEGDLKLAFAGPNEASVTVLGKDEAQPPSKGEVFYKDSQGAICRRWNWREVARTMLTAETKNAVLVLEAVGHVTDEELKQAQTELTKLVKQYCGGESKSQMVDKAQPIVEL